jgi:hypothetical protein
VRISNNYNVYNILERTEKQFRNKLNEILDKTKSSANEVHENKRVAGRLILVSEGINRGKVISIKYADDSTPENPIMCTTTGERVKINDVNPYDATELEIRIYYAHLDFIGKGTNSKFGTYNDLSLVKATAYVNNFTPYSPMDITEESIKNLKFNWVNLTRKVIDVEKNNDPKLHSRLLQLYEELRT